MWFFLPKEIKQSMARFEATEKQSELNKHMQIKENNTFREDLAEAIQVALQFDDEIFMESAVDQVLLLYIFLIVCTRSIEESYTVYSSYSLNIVFISKNS